MKRIINSETFNNKEAIEKEMKDISTKIAQNERKIETAFNIIIIFGIICFICTIGCIVYSTISTS